MTPNFKNNNYIKSIGLVMFLTLLSKIFGFIRDVVLAYCYGASNISDAYLVSITIPEFVLSIVIQAIAVGFIPIYTEIIRKEGNDKANSFINQVLTILYLCGLIAVIFINLFPRQLVLMFASGFEDGAISIAINFVKIVSVGILFKGTVSVLSAYCQANGEFTKPALVGLPLDIIIIIFIMISYKYNTILLAHGTVLAYLSQILIFIPYCKEKNYRYKIEYFKNDPYIKKMIFLLLPVMLSVGTNQINILVDRNLASQISVGGISALNYANKIDNIMENVIVLSIAGVMYPVFSKLSTENKYNELSNSVFLALNNVALIMLPVSIGTMVFAKQIIELLFYRGAFDLGAVDLASKAMLGYSFGMLAVSFRVVLTRVFYSLQEIKTPVINSAFAVLINIVLNYLFVDRLGIIGLALSSSIASIICSILMLYNIKKKISLDNKLLLINCVKILLVSLLMGLICYCVYNYLIIITNKYIALSISVFIGIVSYFFFAKLSRVYGLNELAKVLNDTILRKTNNQS